MRVGIVGAWTAGATLLLLLAACGAVGREPASPISGVVEWREPAAYVVTIEVACGERDAAYGQWRVTVEEGRVVDVAALDERAELTMSIESAPQPPTIGEVLAAANTADGEGAESVTIERGSDGIPRRVEVDYAVDAMDDEACWTISDFVEADAS